MKKIILSTLAVATLLSANSPQLMTKTSQKSHTQKTEKAHTTHWGYTGHSAPEFWGTLDPKFQMCGIGKNQAPIDITREVTLATKGLEPINFIYHAQATEVVNNGHAIQVNVDAHSSIVIDQKQFTLKQFHFHSPSENEIQGRSFPLEAHFVHMAKDGSLAVIAVLFELGDANPALEKIFKAMPHTATNKTPLKLSAQEIETLLPKEKSYYRFSGSLTTPPCSEGVRWFVLKEYQTISTQQLKQFTDVIKGNNRPVQPLNARKVLR